MGALANGVDARFAPGSNVKGAVGGATGASCCRASTWPDRLPRPPVGSGAHHVRATRQRSGGLRAGRGTEKARACRRPRSAGQRLAARGESPRCCPSSGWERRPDRRPTAAGPATTRPGRLARASKTSSCPGRGRLRRRAPSRIDFGRPLARSRGGRGANGRSSRGPGGHRLSRKALLQAARTSAPASPAPGARAGSAGGRETDCPAPCRPGRPFSGTPGRRTSGVRPRDRGRGRRRRRAHALGARRAGDYPLRRCFSSSSGPPARCPMRSSRSPATRN